jgi:hypothetical protein
LFGLGLRLGHGRLGAASLLPLLEALLAVLGPAPAVRGELFQGQLASALLADGGGDGLVFFFHLLGGFWLCVFGFLLEVAAGLFKVGMVAPGDLRVAALSELGVVGAVVAVHGPG